MSVASDSCSKHFADRPFPLRSAATGGVAGAAIGHAHKDHKEDRAVEGKPTMGDKVSGGMDKMMGKMTHNPDKVAEGQAKTDTY